MVYSSGWVKKRRKQTVKFSVVVAILANI